MTLIAWIFKRVRHRCLYRRLRHIWPSNPEGDSYHCILCEVTHSYPAMDSADAERQLWETGKLCGQYVVVNRQIVIPPHEVQPGLVRITRNHFSVVEGFDGEIFDYSLRPELTL